MTIDVTLEYMYVSILGLDKLCWHSFEHNGRQVNMNTMAAFRTHFEMLTHLDIYHTVRRVVYWN